MDVIEYSCKKCGGRINVVELTVCPSVTQFHCERCGRTFQSEADKIIKREI